MCFHLNVVVVVIVIVAGVVAAVVVCGNVDDRKRVYVFAHECKVISLTSKRTFSISFVESAAHSDDRNSIQSDTHTNAPSACTQFYDAESVLRVSSKEWRWRWRCRWQQRWLCNAFHIFSNANGSECTLHCQLRPKTQMEKFPMSNWNFAAANANACIGHQSSAIAHLRPGTSRACMEFTHTQNDLWDSA